LGHPHIERPVPTATEYHLAAHPTYAKPLWVQPTDDEVPPPTYPAHPAWAPGYFLGDAERRPSRRAKRRVHRRERRVARRRGH